MGLSRWSRALKVLALVVVLPALAAASASASVLSSDEDLPLGTDVLSPYGDHNVAGMAEAFEFNAKADGPVDAVNVFLDKVPGQRQSSANARLIAGIYADANGRPGALLGKGQIANFDHRTWNTVPITAVDLQKGKKYWIAVMSTRDEIVIRTFPSNGPSGSVTSPKNQNDLAATWKTDKAFPKDGPASMYAVERYSVLVFTKNATGNVGQGVAALRSLADAKEVTFDVTDDASKFTDDNLAKYRAVVFLNNAGDVLNDDQQKAFEKYFRAGGGFLGIHSAIEAEPDWQFMTDILGTRASGQTEPQDATVKVADRVHIASKGLPEYWTRNDRWYNFTSNVRGFSHVLATVDETTYDEGEANETFPVDDDHPIAWCKDYQGGRSFYTGGGGTADTFSTTGFRRHLAGALDWAAGRADKTYSDCGATVLANYQQTKISAPPNLNEPIGFDQLPDGRIIQTARLGQVRLHDPVAGTSTIINTIPVYNNSEDGLYGPAIDNNFAENHWVYLYYAPVNMDGVSASGSPFPPQTPNGNAPTTPSADPSVWDVWKGYFQLSRFKFVDDPGSPHLDLDSEQKIMRVEVNRGACCHVAGDIDFDKHNNLWLVTGDDTPATSVGANNNPPMNDDKTDEIQSLTFTGGVNGGTFRLTFDGQTTDPIPYPLVNSNIEAALEALPNLDDVVVAGNNANSRTVLFDGNQAQVDVPLMVADASGLTGTGTPAIAVATTQQANLFQAPFNDSRRGATNTNDLRGKVLRIHVNDDGSYSIPDGNLFAPGTPKTRPEIYAMGFRNPFRIQVDENDVAYVTDYSPDSQSPTPLRAAAGTGRMEIVRHPANYGWPMCYSPTLPMYDWNFNTQTSKGRTYDCGDPTHGPTNDSRWNTGQEVLPPITQPDVWYSYREDLWGTPCFGSYNTTTAQPCPSLFPELGTGGVGPHGAAKYHYDPDNPSTTKFPPYYDNAVFFGEFTRDYLREIRLDSQNRVFKINNLLNCGQAVITTPFPFECDNPMDLQFGSDGNFYLLTYGDSFFAANPDAGLYRFSYVKGTRAPNAVLNADRTDGAVPLTVQFNSTGTKDPDPGDALFYEWDFNGDGAVDSTDPAASYTYTTAGVYVAKLTVTDSAGKKDIKTITITAGNTSPTVTINTPVDGDFFDWGESIPYTVSVTDPEDGPITCAEVSVTFILVHDTHGHAGETKQGCSGVFTTNPDDINHGGSIAAALGASYTDHGANGQPALTGTDQHVVNMRRQQVEFVTDQSGTNTANTNDPDGGGLHRGSLNPGDWFALNRSYNLVHMDKKIRIRFAGGAADNTAGNPRMVVEIRAGSPTGDLLSTGTLLSTGANNNTWSTQEIPLDYTGAKRLYLVFRAAPGVISPNGGLGNINWVEFTGPGVNAP